MIDIYQFYDNGKIIQELDMSDYQCFAIKGRVSINEACGGCVGCMLEQAMYGGNWHDFHNEVVDGKNIIKLVYVDLSTTIKGKDGKTVVLNEVFGGGTPDSDDEI